MFSAPAFTFGTRWLTVIAIVLVLLVGYYNPYIATVLAIAFYIAFAYGRERHKEQQEAFAAYLESLTYHVDQAAMYVMSSLPLAMALIDEKGTVHWCNPIFSEWLGREILPGQSIYQMIPDLHVARNGGKVVSPQIIPWEGKYYQLYCKPVDENAEYKAVFITDVTVSETTRLKSQAALPVIAFIQIDNISDVLKGLTESQRGDILAQVNARLADWASEHQGFLKKYAEDMYVAVFNRQSLDHLMNNKFDILDKIRGIYGGNKIPVTLSIGVAADEESILDLGQKAQAQLDLALGRGGDQAAAHVDGKVQFYGGKAKAVEKNTRVKARIISQAVRELVESAELVLIMGHANEDFDSLGAALGIAAMARHLEKPNHIIVSQPGAAVEKLTELLEEYEEYQDILINPAQALEAVTGITPDKVLLFVVDTHRPELAAAPELFGKLEKIIVIDHHRRAESFITNPLLVYLEPSSSSTSELVSELLMYFDANIDLTRLEASALYAGIVVDTKNFAVQTGFRTFESASYLRRAGADPRLVRQLFRVDLESLKHRAKIIANASLLPGGIIVSTCPPGVKNVQMVAAQAADMLLNLEDVKVSFVLFTCDDMVGISARSQGEINVQVIMEQLGGGGHQTMAGAQLKNMDLEEVKQQLIEIVTRYVEESESE